VEGQRLLVLVGQPIALHRRPQQRLVQLLLERRAVLIVHCCHLQGIMPPGRAAAPANGATQHAPRVGARGSWRGWGSGVCNAGEFQLMPAASNTPGGPGHSGRCDRMARSQTLV
jgi:hypothetical protein